MARPRRLSREALSAYRQRLSVLRAMGFPDYDAYLASPLWRSIREKKLLDDSRECFGCGAAGCYQVHHASYAREVLEGKAPDKLFTTCDDCHKCCEFLFGVKVGPRQATEALRTIREKRLLTSEKSRERL